MLLLIQLLVKSRNIYCENQTETTPYQENIKYLSCWNTHRERILHVRHLFGSFVCSYTDRWTYYTTWWSGLQHTGPLPSFHFSSSLYWYDTYIHPCCCCLSSSPTKPQFHLITSHHITSHHITSHHIIYIQLYIL